MMPFPTVFTGAVPGFDPVGNLLKSSWLSERRSQQKQGPEQKQGSMARPDSGFSQSTDRSLRGSGRAPAGQHQARQRAMAALQNKVKQPSNLSQQTSTASQVTDC